MTSSKNDKLLFSQSIITAQHTEGVVFFERTIPAKKSRDCTLNRNYTLCNNTPHCVMVA
jgi:hypothetical protein